MQKQYELLLLASLHADNKRRSKYKAIQKATQPEPINLDFKAEAKNMAKFISLNTIGAIIGLPLLKNYD